MIVGRQDRVNQCGIEAIAGRFIVAQHGKPGERDFDQPQLHHHLRRRAGNLPQAIDFLFQAVQLVILLGKLQRMAMLNQAGSGSRGGRRERLGFRLRLSSTVLDLSSFGSQGS